LRIRVIKPYNLIHSLRQAAFKHGYLIIIAAWLYTISFIFSNYWSYHSSPEKVKSKLEKRLKEEEARFENVLKDTATLYSLISQSPDVTDPLKEDIGLFIYTQDDTDHTPTLAYWNTNRMYINNEDLYRLPGSYF